MKYVRYRTADGGSYTGILSRDEKIISLGQLNPEWMGLDMISIMLLLQDDLDMEKTLRTAAGKNADGTGIPLDQVQLLAPIERPLHDVICVGVNYADHLRETKESFDKNFVEPPAAVYFSKRANRITGSGETVRGIFETDSCLDYEVELAVIIGKGGKNIPRENAAEHIFGYSVFNDLSSRTLQARHNQWYLGKSPDGYTAMGPWIVSADEIAWPPRLDVKSFVNGELRQNSNTQYFIHSIAEMIEDLSACFELECGDIIATGTPSGVGMGFHPPRYLKAGDEVICEISEIGSLRNPVI